MRKKTWKTAAAMMLMGSVFQAGCTQRQINAFTNDLLGALTNGLVNYIEEDLDFSTIIPL